MRRGMARPDQLLEVDWMRVFLVYSTASGLYGERLGRVLAFDHQESGELGKKEQTKNDKKRC